MPRAAAQGVKFFEAMSIGNYIFIVLILLSGASWGKFPYEALPDTGLRSENLTDFEVGEITRKVDGVYPGVIVSIGGSSEGCKCFEGENCSSQVVANGMLGGNPVHVTLSRVGGEWVLSKEWKLRHEIEVLLGKPVDKVRDFRERLRKNENLRMAFIELSKLINSCSEFNN